MKDRTARILLVALTALVAVGMTIESLETRSIFDWIITLLAFLEAFIFAFKPEWIPLIGKKNL